MTNSENLPWYRRAYRWGQTNITEIDPSRYDIGWWREHWRRTRVQGVIINAGGIVAYYPSKLPLQHQAEYLNGRDLFGEVSAAAREEGLAVVARMDSNRAREPFFQAHPDWFARDRGGNPYRAGIFYVFCINSPYYDEYIPNILREIIERSQPDGFADNSWSGLDRNHICYCDNCVRKFRAAYGTNLPRKPDWDDPAYRQWIQWNYDRRLEVWDLNNRTTKSIGGPDCLWIGMNSGNILGQSVRFRDYKAICERSELVFLDSQTRHEAVGFQSNGDMGKLIHGLLGWDKLIPESMAMYQSPNPAFRVASRPEPEARMWVVEGFAATIQPWWHHIGAYHEDRRQYRTAEPLFRWHEANQEYLLNRRPLASVGLVWSQQNVDFYGRDKPEERTMMPYYGMMQALIRARIPYLPVHADHIQRDAANLSALILPNVGAMSDSQCESVRRFVEGGGGLIASGESSRYDELGNLRPDFALSDLFRAHTTDQQQGAAGIASPSWEAYETHSYLRLNPELRSRVYGPKAGTEPPITGERHPVLRGFDETDIIPFGGRLEVVRIADGAEVPLTYIPPFPIYPPETAWMRQPDTNEAALVLNTTATGGRVAYLPANIDYCFARGNLPDHGDLLANLVRWAAKERLQLKVEGAGLIDCHLYHQPGRLILHLVNLTSAGTWRAPVHELIPVGPLQVNLWLPEDVSGKTTQCLVSSSKSDVVIENGWIQFEILSVTDHEVVVIS